MESGLLAITVPGRNGHGHGFFCCFYPPPARTMNRGVGTDLVPETHSEAPSMGELQEGCCQRRFLCLSDLDARNEGCCQHNLLCVFDNSRVHFLTQLAGVLIITALDGVLYHRIRAAHLTRYWMELTLLLILLSWAVVALVQLSLFICLLTQTGRGQWHDIPPVATMESVGLMLAGLVLTGAAINLDNNYMTKSSDQKELLSQLDIWVPLAVGFQGAAIASAMKVMDMLAKELRAPHN